MKKSRIPETYIYIYILYYIYIYIYYIYILYIIYYVCVYICCNNVTKNTLFDEFLYSFDITSCLLIQYMERGYIYVYSIFFCLTASLLDRVQLHNPSEFHRFIDELLETIAVSGFHGYFWTADVYKLLVRASKIGGAAVRIALDKLKALALLLFIAVKRSAFKGEDLKLNHIKLQ